MENIVKKNAANTITITLNKTAFEYGIVILSGWLFILMFSSWTSPIFEGSYGYDSAFFSMVGRAILEGKVMYRDYFDVKGPVFFFWEAFGQFLHRDRPGIFILQLICITGTVTYLYKLCKLYGLSVKKTVLVFFVFYFVFATCLWGGNSVEEYCLPLTMGCMYYGIRYLKGISNNLNIALFFGITFGICALSKITVCVPMAAVTLVIFIKLIYEKNTKGLLRCVLLFLAGVVIVALPVFIYYIANDALDDMMLCAFNIAFKRSTDYYEKVSWKWEQYLMVCYGAFFLFISKIKEKTVEKYILLSLTVMTFVALHLGTPFDYYFVTTLPLTAYVVILFSVDTRDLIECGAKSSRYVGQMLWRICFAVITIVITIAAYFVKTTDKVAENYRICFEKSEKQFYDQCREVYEMIPEEYRHDIYCIESGMIFYEVNQTLPSNKYPVNMPYFCQLYPPAEKEILDVINNHPPMYIVAEDVGEVDNENIKFAIYDHYEEIGGNSMDKLWKRIDN